MIILVTGVSSGFGRAIAKALAAKGHRRPMVLPCQGAYSASKFAIEDYCEALRLELRRSGVQEIVIEPGDFSTSFTAMRKCVDVAQASEAYPSYGKSLSGIEHNENNGLKPEYLAVFAKWLLPASLFQKILSLYYGV